MIAFVFSYGGHYYISFRSNHDHAATVAKYLITALIGLTLNTVTFILIVNIFKLHYMIAFAVVVVLSPPVIFFISRNFVFKDSGGTNAQLFNGELFRRLAINYGIAGLFFLLTATYVIVFHFKAPYFDQWDFVRLFGKLDAGTLGVGDIFNMHGAHWHASAYAVLLPLAALTNMNHLYEGLASLAFAFTGYTGLAVIVMRVSKEYSIEWASPVLLAVAAAIWFSLDQSLNWLWGWQVAVFINTAGAVWCIALLSSAHLTVLKLVMALIAFSAAILAFATAYTLLPIGFILLFLNYRRSEGAARRAAAIYLGVWALATICVLMAYFQYHHAGDAAAGGRSGVGWLLSYLAFLVNYIASPITRFATGLALPVVMTGGYLLYWAARRSGFSLARLINQPGTLALFALMIYGLSAGVLIGIGRVGEYGAVQGFSSRYISFGNFFWIGAFIFVLSIMAQKKMLVKRISTPGAVIGVLLALMIGNSISGGNKYIQQAPKRANAIETLLLARPGVDRDALLVFSNSTQQLDDDIAFLERRQLSLFRVREEKPN